MLNLSASSVARGAVEVVVARLDLEPAALGALAGLLRASERQRACRFRFERDRRRYVVARARLRQLLAARLDTQPRSVRLARGIHGKPALARGGAADWRFSVSHSRDIALYAFCLGREVGIDVEAVHEMQDADAIAVRYFPPSELAAFRLLAPRDQALGFFGGWTRTEAIACDEASGWRLHSFSPAPGYVAALAVERA